MTADEVVSRFTINARTNFVKLRAGMTLTGNQLNGLKLRGVLVYRAEGWACDPSICEAFDRRWPKNPIIDKPRRVLLRRTAGWKMPANTVKVDRSTIWGNPFVVGKKTPDGIVLIGNNRAAVDAFRMKVQLRLQDQIAADPDFRQFTVGNLRSALGGKNLACWCSLDEPCHADVLLGLANK